MSTIARRDGWRGSGCSRAGTTLALGESKTLKQRRCAACGGMHVDGARSSSKHGSKLAGKCPPPPQAAGHPTLRDGSTSNGTSADRPAVDAVMEEQLVKLPETQVQRIRRRWERRKERAGRKG